MECYFEVGLLLLWGFFIGWFGCFFELLVLVCLLLVWGFFVKHSGDVELLNCIWFFQNGMQVPGFTGC